nr:hypothetical protein [Tanacetum cinerariifolium]
MSKDPSIPRRNKINWHYVRDDSIFLTIKVVSRHQNTQQYGAMLPIELTNDEIRNTKAYKEYYAFATREAVPKPKASARRKRSGSDTSITPLTTTTTTTTTVAVTPRLTAAAKGKLPAKAKSPSDPSEVAKTEAQQLKIVLRRSRQQTHISQLGGSGTDEGIGSKPGVPDVPTDESEEELSWNSSDDEGADDQEKVGDDEEGDEGNDSEEGEEDDDDDEDRNGDERDNDDEVAKHDDKDDTKESGNVGEEGESDEEDDDEETRDDESFDPIPQTSEIMRMKVMVRRIKGRGIQATLDVEDSYVTLTPVHLDGQQESSSVSSHFVTIMLNPPSDVGMESIFATASSSVAPLQTSTPIMTPYTISTITTISHAPIPPTTIPSKVLQHLPTFDSVFCFEDILKSLEANFSEYIQTNSFAEVVSNISGIVHQYMNQQTTEARIIKDQVKSQLKEQVSRILPRIEQFVNAQLEAEVLTTSSHLSRASYAVAADLSEMELKKILIEKMEGNKSIQRSEEQKNLYKALVDPYKADKTIFDSYGETVILKRRRDDDDDQEEEPSVGSDRGSKRRRECKEPESASALLETATRSTGRSTTGSKSRQVSTNESAFAVEPVQTTYQMDEPSNPVFETGADDQPIVQSSQHSEWFSQPKKPLTPDRDWNKTLPAVQESTQTWISELAKLADSRSSFNELLDTPLDFSNFIMNRLRVDTPTPKLLAGPTYELMKGSCTSLIELECHLEEVYKATMDQLDWVNPEGQQYPHNLLQPLSLIPNNRGRRVEHKNQKRSNEMYYPRFTKVIIDYFMTRKPSISRRNRINWHYVRDDVLFSTIKVVSRHQTTQQYGAILPIELTTDDIRNSKAYKEYYACATREEAPKPKASTKKKKGDSASSTTPPTPTPTTTVVSALRLSTTAKGKQPARAITPTEPTDVQRTKAEQLKIALKRSRQETHISQQRGLGTDEGTGSRPGVSDVPSDDSEEELSWNSSDDEEGDEQTKASSESDKDDDDNDDEEEPTKNNDEDTETGKGGDEVSESEGVESIFTTASSPIVSFQTPTPIMTPSIIATITTSGDAPIPSTTIPS